MICGGKTVLQNEEEDEDGMVATCVSRLWPLQLESVAWLLVARPRVLYSGGVIMKCKKNAKIQK